MMREQCDYKLFIGGKYGIQSLSNECSTNVERMLNFVEDCVSEFKLFIREGEYIWSDSLLRRMQKKETISLNNQKAGKLSAEKRQQNQGFQVSCSTSVQHPFNIRSTNVERGANEVSTIKESKDKGNLKETKKENTHARPMVELVQEEKVQQNQGFRENEKIAESQKSDIEYTTYVNPANKDLIENHDMAKNDSKSEETKKRQKVAEWFLKYISIHPKKTKRFLVEQIWFEMFLNPSLSDQDAQDLYTKIITTLRLQKDKHPRDDTNYTYFPAADAWLRDGRWMDEVETKQPETIKEIADRMRREDAEKAKREGKAL